MNYETGHNLPDKLYFRIGEVSDIVGVKPYVLRYWETEFTDIKPTKSKSGQRLYRKRDVELLLKIRDLLYTERFTINGAKQRLKEVGKLSSSVPELDHVADNSELSETETETYLSSQVEDEMAPEEGDLFSQHVIVKTEEKKIEPVAETKSVTRNEEVKVSPVDRKFLEKVKNDLEWCLSEMKSA